MLTEVGVLPAIGVEETVFPLLLPPLQLLPLLGLELLLPPLNDERVEAAGFDEEELPPLKDEDRPAGDEDDRVEEEKEEDLPDEEPDDDLAELPPLNDDPPFPAACVGVQRRQQTSNDTSHFPIIPSG